MTASGAAYGLRLQGLGADLAEQRSAPAEWPAWSVRARPSDESQPAHIGTSRAWIPLHTGGGIDVDGDAATFEFVTPQPLTERALAHPYLAPAAAVAALWSGGLPLHGGAFVADGSAWVVLGAATSGKSTLLACLARQGVPVLSDDLAVVRDGAVAVGARCIDLRADAARTLGCGEPLGFVGKRERWRMTLPPAPASAPLGGFVALDWGDATGAREADPSERLRALAANLAVVAGSPDVETLLDLAARPMVRIERARRLDRLDAIASLVLNRVTQRKF